MTDKRILITALLAGLGLSSGSMAGEGTPADGKAPPAKSASVQYTAAQIVDRNLEVRGGLTAWRAVESMTVTGKMDVGTGDSAQRAAKISRGGRAKSTKAVYPTPVADAGAANSAQQVQLPFLLEMKRPNKSRVEIEFAGKTAIQVYDGTSGWKLRPFLNRGDVEPFTAEESRNEGSRDGMVGPLVDYAAKGTRIALEATEPVEGRDAYRLKLTMKDGRVQHIWIDAQTFLDVKLDGAPRRMDGRARDVWIYQRDFRPVQGLMVPYVLETAVDGFRETHKMVVEKVVVNPALDDALFVKPKG